MHCAKWKRKSIYVRYTEWYLAHKGVMRACSAVQGTTGTTGTTVLHTILPERSRVSPLVYIYTASTDTKCIPISMCLQLPIIVEIKTLLYSATVLWNSLPDDVKNATSPNSFKVLVKNYIKP